MKFNIFFDESHQLDKHSSKYCYYGILGYEENKVAKLEKLIKEKGIKYELHFSDFRLNQLEGYYEVIKFVLNESKSNIYMVNCEQALSLGKNIQLDPKNVRKLFYIKLPERLIYGMTRKLSGVKDINITIDKSDTYGNNNLELLDTKSLEKIEGILQSKMDKDEQKNNIKSIVEEKYKHIQLTKSLKEQLNSHSLYRNLNYKINKIRQEDSKENIALQSIDVLLGVVSYIFEEKYLDLPEEIEEKILTSRLNEVTLTESEEELLFKAYNLNNGKYRIEKGVSNEVSLKLRDLNKKLLISSSKNIQKAEFIYRVVSDNLLLDKLYNSDIFIWTLDNKDISKNINKIYISKYISKFINYKINFDNNKYKILIKKYVEDTIAKKEVDKKEYANCLNLNNSIYHLMDRYLEVLGIKIKKDNDL